MSHQTERQALAVLERLRRAPASTIDLRTELGILHPAGRVFALRQQGHVIRTVIRWDTDAEGRPHAVAVYTLEGGHERA